MLILAFGTGTLGGTILSCPPLVAIGLVSYSAYLWHHPVFAFGHYVSLSDNFSPGTTATLCGTTLTLAWASWRWIETPFRDRHPVSRRTLIAVSGVASICLLTGGLVVALSKHAPTRWRLLPGALLQTSADRIRVMQECGFRPTAASPGCALDPASSEAPAFLVMGDSHAAAMLPAFQRLSQRTGKHGRLVAQLNCPPLLGSDDACGLMPAAALDFVRRHDVNAVFLVSRWAAYTENPERRPAFAERLTRTMDAYRAADVRVYLVEEVPQQRYRPVGIYVQALLQRDSGTFIRRMSVTRVEHDARQMFIAHALAPYRTRDQVTLIDLASVLCDGDGICPVGTRSQSFYWDATHLSVAGALFVSEALDQWIVPMARR